MKVYLYELKKRNKLRSQKLLRQNQETLRKCLQYLKMSDITPYEYEMLRKHLIDIAFQEQEKYSSLESYLGENAKKKLDETILSRYEKKKSNEHILYTFSRIIVGLFLYSVSYAIVIHFFEQSLHAVIYSFYAVLGWVLIDIAARKGNVKKVLFADNLQRNSKTAANGCYFIALLMITKLLEMLSRYLEKTVGSFAILPTIFFLGILSIILLCVQISTTNRLLKTEIVG